MHPWVDDLSCPCCGVVKLSGALELRLSDLHTRLGDAVPRATLGYMCEAFRTSAPWSYDRAHSEGRSVTFALVDQYHRHRALLAILDTFDRVWIHGTRVTCFVDDTHQAPWCVVV